MSQLRHIATHFQRSVNLLHDLGDADYVAAYIPTMSGAEALAAILAGTQPQARQRAHLLHAAYGSGKSLLSVVMSALISQDPRTIKAGNKVAARLERLDAPTYQTVQDYRANGKRLLPIVLSGDEGSFSVALLRALKQTLQRHGLAELPTPTPFHAARAVIDRWAQSYPALHQQLQAALRERGSRLAELEAALETLQPNALTLFEQLYPALTGGAHFDRFAGPSLEAVFQQTAEALQEASDYDGLFIIWDEFGRFLEARTADAFGPEAAHLQDFAEFCNRSGATQVHLVLITHRLFSVYATDLPLLYQQEWARIAERFRTHNVSSDPDVTYRLITEALYSESESAWQQFRQAHQQAFQELTAHTLDFHLFEESDDARLRQQVIESAWPLHPLVVYALPRLAAQVAQNERTLFTFLAADEPGTLASHLYFQNGHGSWWLARVDLLWDYFAEAIRRDEVGHAIWSGVNYALGKVPPTDHPTRAIVKALGVLLLVGESNLQAEAHLGGARPTTPLLAWAVGITEQEAAQCLERLANRKALTFRQAEGYWTFMRGSDVDLEAATQEALTRHAPTRQQLRQLLERYVEAPFYLPRRYNQEYAITRFFWSLYRWPQEMAGIAKTAFLKELGPAGYADGAVVFLLATNEVERSQALDTIPTLPESRTLFVIPHHPLLIEEPLREIFALRDLQNDPTFLEQDERLSGEIEFLVEDARRRLKRALRPLEDPTLQGASWWWHNGTSWQGEGVSNAVGISKMLSQLTERWFPQTPALNNESINQHEPTGQQSRAMEGVIDALLHLPHEALPEDLTLSGYGADWLIVRTLLIRTGLLHQVASPPLAEGEPPLYRLDAPLEGPLATIWQQGQQFLDRATEVEQGMEELVDQFLSPPYGLRRGVLPLLLAAMMRPRLPVLTIRHNRRVVSPLTGELFTAMVAKPQAYTIEVGPWDERRQVLWELLDERFTEYLTQDERAQQPLSYLSIGMLRWLQFQPRYCRDTRSLSEEALQFRQLVRQAQRDPARVLLHDMLALLERDVTAQPPAEDYRTSLAQRLSTLRNEIATAYQGLLYQLDQFAISLFGDEAALPAPDGHSALQQWLARLARRSDTPLASFRFGDMLVQRLIVVGTESDAVTGTTFWDALSQAVLGLSLHDWNDRSVLSFQEKLREAKERAEREIVELSEEDEVIELRVHLPRAGEQQYRFRTSTLSPHGQRILQNFRSTLEIAGRPLSPDEKRQVVLALLHEVLESP